jgi:hypothetical protein
MANHDAQLTDVIAGMAERVAHFLSTHSPRMSSTDGAALIAGIVILLVTIGLLVYDFLDLSGIGIETRATRRSRVLRSLGFIE